MLESRDYCYRRPSRLVFNNRSTGFGEYKVSFNISSRGKYFKQPDTLYKTHSTANAYSQYYFCCSLTIF